MSAAIPKTMKAFVLEGHGGPDKLAWRESWRIPDVGEGEVLVRVGACGLNNTDINTRTGWYSSSGDTDGADAAGGSWGGGAIEFPRVQGADVAGEVVLLGGGVDPALLGRRVMLDPWLRAGDGAGDGDGDGDVLGYLGSECDGGFAEYVKVPAVQAHVVDCDLSDAELATFATSYATAENMLSRAGVGAGDRVLVTGASGGVGSALIQLSARRGAEVLALSVSGKFAALRAAGASYVIDRGVGDLPAAVRDCFGAGVTVAADVAGGGCFGALLDCLERGGRYVCSGAVGGYGVSLDLRRLYLRDLTFYGATVYPRVLFASLVRYIESGEVRPLLAREFGLRELREAQEFFLTRGHVGKVVVVP